MLILRRMPALIVLLAGVTLQPATVNLNAQSLTVQVGDRERQIEARIHENQVYYDLDDLAETLELSATEISSNEIRVGGPRGELHLSAGRRLVRLSDQYVALSADVWRRGTQDWYVPRGFIEKALPLLLDRKLEFLSESLIRVEALARNPVRINIANYPDHVSVVFQTETPVTPEVTEYRQYIEVQFSEFLVEPRMTSTAPDPNLVSSVEFNAQHAYGSFRIMKGPGYGVYREYFLENPLRLVVDIYGDSLPDLVESAPGSETTPSDPRAPRQYTSEADPFDARIRGVIVLDPGHGGEDPGTRSQEFSEKLLALRLAREIEERLEQAGHAVRMTRSRDVGLPLEQRSSIANYFDSRAFISLHFGGAPSPETRGPVVYFYSSTEGGTSNTSQDELNMRPGSSGILADLTTWHDGQNSHSSASQRLAGLLQNELNQIFGTDNSVSQLPLEALAPVQAPAVMIEAGFLTSPADRELLASAQFQERVADAVSRALERFLQ